MKIRCIRCDRTVAVETCYICPSCEYEFNRIDSIPIFLNNAVDYFSNKILSGEHRIRELEGEIIPDAMGTIYDAKYARINKAIASQINIVRDLQNTLLSHCPAPALLQNIGKAGKNGYGMTLEYLIRDWSLSAETEKEICTIKDAIFTKLPSARRDRVLVLGAGLGRIAFELLDEFKEVYAVDLSIEMPWLLEQLLTRGQIGFTYYYRKNVANPETLLADYQISSTYAAGKADRLNGGRLNYFVADAADLPFPDDHFDAIVSCYFTDVVPLHSMMAEITRVLRRSASFVHFGPLDFHFPEASKFLTFEEVLATFNRFGYETASFQPVLLEHVALPNRFNKKLYNNQLFTARKTGTEPNAKLNKHSVLKLISPISFSVHGRLTEKGEMAYRAAEFTVESGMQYQGALAVFEILSRLDGKKTLDAIFSAVAGQYAVTGAVRKKLISILETLRWQGVVGMVN